MLKTILTVILILHLIACSSSDNQAVESTLLEVLLSHPNDTERYKACALLGELNFAANLLSGTPQGDLSSEQRLCFSYLATKREPSAHNLAKFFQSIEDQTQQKRIWRLHAQSDNPVGLIPPTYNLLAYHAQTNQQALYILLGSLLLTDGAYAESLSEVIANLYRQNPDRIESAFLIAKIPKGEIEYIKQISQYR